MTFYIHLCSKDDKNIFPDNNSTQFRCLLPKTLTLKDDYELALIDIHGTFPTVFNVECNIVNKNVIKGQYMSILKRVYDNNNFKNILFVPVKEKYIDIIEIKLLDNDLNILRSSSEYTLCTLCLKKSG